MENNVIASSAKKARKLTEAEIAEIDEKVAETYEMVQQSVDGKIAEVVTKPTNAKSAPSRG